MGFANVSSPFAIAGTGGPPTGGAVGINWLVGVAAVVGVWPAGADGVVSGEATLGHD